MGTWVHGYMGTWVHGYMGTWVHGYMGTTSPVTRYKPCITRAADSLFSATTLLRVPFGVFM